MNVLCIIQARMGSSRLPGKMLREVAGKPILGYVLDRVALSPGVARTVVATTTSLHDDDIERYCASRHVSCFRGSVDDVLGRYFACAMQYPVFPAIVRITGDCPLIDPCLIDEVIERFSRGDCDMASNVEERTFPDGMDIEVFSRTILQKAHEQARLASEREHVTLWMRTNPSIKKCSIAASKNYGSYRIVVDHEDDLGVIDFLVRNSSGSAGYHEYVKLLDEHPEIRRQNAHHGVNEGLAKSFKQDRIVNANEKNIS